MRRGKLKAVYQVSRFTGNPHHLVHDQEGNVVMDVVTERPRVFMGYTAAEAVAEARLGLADGSLRF